MFRVPQLSPLNIEKWSFVDFFALKILSNLHVPADSNPFKYFLWCLVSLWCLHLSFEPLFCQYWLFCPKNVVQIYMLRLVLNLQNMLGEVPSTSSFLIYHLGQILTVKKPRKISCYFTEFHHFLVRKFGEMG